MNVPTPPRYSHWPVAVQHAMCLRGALVRCGPGVRGVGWPDNTTVRITALTDWLSYGVIAAYLTAAWVWHATDDPGSPLSMAVFAGQHGSKRPSDTLTYELRLAATDVVSLHGLNVTTPFRTLIDLIYRPEPFGAVEQQACRELVRRDPRSEERLRQYIAHYRRPHARMARQRLPEILTPDSSP